MVEQPEGYTEYALVSYPTAVEKQAKFLAGFGVFILIGVLAALHGIGFLRDQIILFCVIFILIGGVAMVMHEMIHGVVYILFGYEIDWGVADRLSAFYTGAFDQFITRKESMLALSAPLLSLNLMFFPLFFSPMPLPVFSAFAVLVVNTSMSRGDLYAISRIYNAPPDSLVYHTKPEEFRIYNPNNERFET